jgi:hypothetical protein
MRAREAKAFVAAGVATMIDPRSGWDYLDFLGIDDSTSEADRARLKKALEELTAELRQRGEKRGSCPPLK